LGVVEVVIAEPLLAGLALDQRIAEPGEVPRRLPDLGVLEDRRVERDYVVAVVDHRPPPLVLDVVSQQHAVVAVVVGRAEAPIYLRRGKDEAASLAERDDLIECDLGGLAAGGHQARRGFAPCQESGSRISFEWSPGS